MAVWPITLPQRPLRDPLAGAGEAVLIRSSMEAGEAKVRARTVAATKPVMLSYVMTQMQMTIFENWFTVDLAKGVLRFTAPSPFRPGTMMVIRMTGGSGSAPYDFVPGPRGQWIVSFAAEIMPS